MPTRPTEEQIKAYKAKLDALDPADFDTDEIDVALRERLATLREESDFDQLLTAFRSGPNAGDAKLRAQLEQIKAKQTALLSLGLRLTNAVAQFDANNPRYKTNTLQHRALWDFIQENPDQESVVIHYLQTGDYSLFSRLLAVEDHNPFKDNARRERVDSMRGAIAAFERVYPGVLNDEQKEYLQGLAKAADIYKSAKWHKYERMKQALIDADPLQVQHVAAGFTDVASQYADQFSKFLAGLVVQIPGMPRAVEEELSVHSTGAKLLADLNIDCRIAKDKDSLTRGLLEKKLIADAAAVTPALLRDELIRVMVDTFNQSAEGSEFPLTRDEQEYLFAEARQSASSYRKVYHALGDGTYGMLANACTDDVRKKRFAERQKSIALKQMRREMEQAIAQYDKEQPNHKLLPYEKEKLLYVAEQQFALGRFYHELISVLKAGNRDRMYDMGTSIFGEDFKSPDGDEVVQGVRGLGAPTVVESHLITMALSASKDNSGHKKEYQELRGLLSGPNKGIYGVYSWLQKNPGWDLTAEGIHLGQELIDKKYRSQHDQKKIEVMAKELIKRMTQSKDLSERKFETKQEQFSTYLAKKFAEMRDLNPDSPPSQVLQLAEMLHAINTFNKKNPGQGLTLEQQQYLVDKSVETGSWYHNQDKRTTKITALLSALHDGNYDDLRTVASVNTGSFADLRAKFKMNASSGEGIFPPREAAAPQADSTVAKKRGGGPS